MLVSEPSYLDAEQEGDTELTLVAIRYEGPRNNIAANGALRNQGYWPGQTTLNQGVWYTALVPDQGLPYYEQHANITIEYSQEGIAEAILSPTELPWSVFGRNSDKRLQERVFEELGLENVGLGKEREEEYREQLREIAGIDEDDEDEEDNGLFDTTSSTSREESLVDNNSRSELQQEANELGMEGTGSAGKTELAEYIAENEE